MFPYYACSSNDLEPCQLRNMVALKGLAKAGQSSIAKCFSLFPWVRVFYTQVCLESSVLVDLTYTKIHVHVLYYTSTKHALILWIKNMMQTAR